MHLHPDEGFGTSHDPFLQLLCLLVVIVLYLPDLYLNFLFLDFKIRKYQTEASIDNNTETNTETETKTDLNSLGMLQVLGVP